MLGRCSYVSRGQNKYILIFNLCCMTKSCQMLLPLPNHLAAVNMQAAHSRSA